MTIETTRTAPSNTDSLLASSNPNDARMRAKCMLIEEHRLRPINVDVTAACQLWRRAARVIEPMVDEVIRVIPGFEREWITDLGAASAFALLAYAASNQQVASKVASELLVECNALRKDMQSWARSCRELGFIQATQLEEFERLPYSYKDTPYVLVQLTLLFNRNRAALAESVKLSWDRIDAARDLANRLGDFAGIDGKPEISAEARELAVRAFTNAADMYDECRWAIAYVRRHEGDAAALTPPFGNRSTGRGAARESDPIEPVDPRPAPPVEPQSLRESDARGKGGAPESPFTESPFIDER